MHTRWMSAIFVNNGLVVSGQLGVWYGRITDNTNGTYQSWAQHRAEDSGRAADLHVPGGAYRSRGNGYQTLVVAGITTAMILSVRRTPIPVRQPSSPAFVLEASLFSTRSTVRGSR